MVESPKWNERHKRLSCWQKSWWEGLQWLQMRPVQEVMWLVFSKSEVRGRNQMKPGVRWRCVGNPIIPPVLSNKSFIIFSCGFFFNPSLVLGVFESYEIWKNAEVLILSWLKVLYKCQSLCMRIWDAALLVRALLMRPQESRMLSSPARWPCFGKSHTSAHLQERE